MTIKLNGRARNEICRTVITLSFTDAQPLGSSSAGKINGSEAERQMRAGFLYYVALLRVSQKMTVLGRVARLTTRVVTPLSCKIISCSIRGMTLLTDNSRSPELRNVSFIPASVHSPSSSLSHLSFLPFLFFFLFIRKRVQSARAVLHQRLVES